MKNSIWLGALLSPLPSTMIILALWMLFLPGDQIPVPRKIVAAFVTLLPIGYAFSLLFVLPTSWLLNIRGYLRFKWLVSLSAFGGVFTFILVAAILDMELGPGAGWASGPWIARVVMFGLGGILGVLIAIFYCSIVGIGNSKVKSLSELDFGNLGTIVLICSVVLATLPFSFLAFVVRPEVKEVNEFCSQIDIGGPGYSNVSIAERLQRAYVSGHSSVDENGNELEGVFVMAPTISRYIGIIHGCSYEYQNEKIVSTELYMWRVFQ